RVVGHLSAREALRQLLYGTGLTFEFVNERTVTVRLPQKMPPPAEGAAAQTSISPLASGQLLAMQSVEAPVGDSSKSTAEEEQAGDKKAEPELTVTGSRIRTMVGEQTLQPVFIMDRQAIERTGAADLGEVFKYIPQITSSTDGTGSESYSPASGASVLPN